MAAPTRELRKSWGLSRTPLVLPFHSLSLSLRPSIFLSLFLTLPFLSLSFSLLSRHERARASTDTYYMDADVGGEDWWAGAAEGRLIPVPRGSRSAPHLREGAAASQTFRAETRFLTGNFVRLRLPPLQQRQLLRRRLARRWSSSSSVAACTDNLVCRSCTPIDKNLSSRIS